MSKDVILDRYARLYEIPYQLARLGHEVRGYCLSYQSAPTDQWTHEAVPGTLSWQSRPLWPSGIGYWRTMLNELKGFRPDLLIGASDIPHLALTARLARKLGIPWMADLYDNFEGFGQARIPGMKTLLKNAVRNAPLVTTTSQTLADYIRHSYGTCGQIISMPSTIDRSVFYRRDQSECRRALGLPESAKLIGTAGGLLGKRGIGTVFTAWRQLALEYPDIHLVLAGPTDPNCPPPDDERVHYLGLLPHAQTAELFSALDVGIIYLRDTTFGRYCFPQKAYEMGASGIPIVAARVGVMIDVLEECPQCLYEADNAEDLKRCILGQLNHPTPPDIPIEDWIGIIGKLETRLRALVTPHER